VWNASRWFREPLSIQQIVSWTIIVGSTALAVHGVHLLRSVGRAQRRVMENTRSVVEVGAYRYIRHPLYASLMFFGWGVFFKGLDVSTWLISVQRTLST
jgi:protein-S-isoprenylcysteine O-methyltransferase Ste14